MIKYPKIENRVNWNYVEKIDYYPDEFVAQEKIDGSQFRMYLPPNSDAMIVGTKNVQYGEERPPDKGFSLAVERALEAGKKFKHSIWYDKNRGYTFFMEYLKGERQNTLTYKQPPKNNLYLFDLIVDSTNAEGIWVNDSDFLIEIAKTMEIEPVHIIDRYNELPVLDSLQEAMNTMESSLGGQIEGIVFKNYGLAQNGYGSTHPFMLKVVRSVFSEDNTKNWNLNRTSKGNIVERCVALLNKENVWNKIWQHATENGELVGQPKDIAILMKGIENEFVEEYDERLMKQVYQMVRPQIIRGISRGFPQWYKDKLYNEVREEINERE